MPKKSRVLSDNQGSEAVLNHTPCAFQKMQRVSLPYIRSVDLEMRPLAYADIHEVYIVGSNSPDFLRTALESKHLAWSCKALNFSLVKSEIMISGQVNACKH